MISQVNFHDAKLASLLDSELEAFTESFQFNHPNVRHARSATGCPGGAGNLGFNSFNFLTFVLMVFNAVANTNNNANNNNNNNNDINLNSVSQNSNQVVSNSDNMNTIMAMILPLPVGRRRKRAVRDILRRASEDCGGRGMSAVLVAYELMKVEAAKSGIKITELK